MRFRPAPAALAAIILGTQLGFAVGVGAQNAPEFDAAITRPGSVVIDTFDPTIDVDDPALVAEVERIQRDQRTSAQSVGVTEVPTGRSALVSGITVSYLNGSTPSEVRAVVDSAVSDWNAALKTSPSGPVHITFDWQDLSSLPGVLGFAGPTGYVLRGSYWFPVALANTLDNVDYNNSQSELEVTVASQLLNVSGGWYANANSTNIPVGRLDLYTTVVHEIGHGLGFVGSATQVDQFTPPTLGSPPDKYDSLVSVDGNPLLNLGNPNSYLTSNNLDIAIGGGRQYEVFAPSTFMSGSSFSHFDEDSYRNGAPGALMTPGLSDGEIARVLDAPTLGVLSESGWPMDVGPVTPTINNTTIGPGSATVSWSVDLGDNGTPPTSFVVEARQGSTVRRSVTVGGTTTSTTLGGLVDGQTYTIRVTPSSYSTAGTPDEAVVALLRVPGIPTLVTVVGAGLSRTVTWEMPSDNGTPITNFVVDHSKNGGSFSQLGTTSGTTLGTGSLSNDVYQFRVRAINANGSSDHGYSLPVGFSNTVVRPLPLDGELARLYQAYFDRLPDAAGMAFYMDQRARGVSLLSVSESFAASPEFTSTYGSLGNRDFVERLYLNVFGRPGDTAGVSYWTAQLDGGRSRGEVVIGFSQSTEFVLDTGTAAVQTVIEGAVYRLYLAYFLRPPDDAGMTYWTGQVAGGLSLAAVSSSFAQSAEFIARYGNLTNTEFIDLVYANVLTRTPDAAGYDYWLVQLNAGMARGNVMLAFSESVEFIVRTGTVT